MSSSNGYACLGKQLYSIQYYLYSAFYDTTVAKQLYRKFSFYNIFTILSLCQPCVMLINCLLLHSIRNVYTSDSHVNYSIFRVISFTLSNEGLRDSSPLPELQLLAARVPSCCLGDVPSTVLHVSEF